MNAYNWIPNRSDWNERFQEKGLIGHAIQDLFGEAVSGCNGLNTLVNYLDGFTMWEPAEEKFTVVKTWNGENYGSGEWNAVTFRLVKRNGYTYFAISNLSSGEEY